MTFFLIGLCEFIKNPYRYRKKKKKIKQKITVKCPPVEIESDNSDETLLPKFTGVNRKYH